MRILSDEMKLMTSIGYSITVSNPEREYTVHGGSSKAKSHVVEINEAQTCINCDCTTFASFQIFCRHILGVFESQPSLDPTKMLTNLNIRWKPEHQDNNFKIPNNDNDEFGQYRKNTIDKINLERGNLLFNVTKLGLLKSCNV